MHVNDNSSPWADTLINALGFPLEFLLTPKQRHEFVDELIKISHTTVSADKAHMKEQSPQETHLG
jgi:hypothetical protein